MSLSENQNAEQRARDNIDAKLREAGWEVQGYAAMNLTAGRGVAVREFPMKRGHGKADYLLYVDRAAVGVVEAKPEGASLVGVEVQSEKYSVGLPEDVPARIKPLPFLYESTGVETRFTNALDPQPRSRDVFTFHRPETFAGWLSTNDTPLAAEESKPYDLDTLLGRIQKMPPLDTKEMRDCQIEAITNLEASLRDNRPRALVQMQTGSGKTFMTVAQCYRLLKYAKAKRILFLVDRNTLAKQTLTEFQAYDCPGDGRKFTALYNVQWLQSNKIDPAASVVITTIQRLYSILKGEPEFDEEAEEQAGGAYNPFRKEPLPVVYNEAIPMETFDFIFTDECHRSIYNVWRQVLEYFDAYLIGLTATPSKQTLGFFKQNLVMEYGHARAVADKVNVDFDVYKIITRITQQGDKIEAGTVVDKRDKKTRKVRWEELEDDLDYAPNELDRGIVVPDQIRTIIRTFKEKVCTEIFPGRKEVPKTLIFAKSDSHADDIVKIIREEFAKGNDFCEKITYRTSTARIVDPETGDVTYKNTNIKPEDLISAFRNSYNPRIAVTVDMIATGTDIRPLEIVFFMRDVASANYFEQMKGRGCRTISPTEFQNVTNDAVNKTRYVIIDAVGLTERERKDSIPVAGDPSVSLKQIMQAVATGNTTEKLVSTLGGRLARLDNVINPGTRKQIEELAGMPLGEMVKNLITAVDPDAVEDTAMARHGNTEEGTVAKVGEKLRQEAVEPFHNAKLREIILLAQQDSEQTIDPSGKDEVVIAGADEVSKQKAKTLIESWAKYLEENKDEITAIQLLYSRPRGKAPTFRQLKELASAIELPPRSWSTELLWDAYEKLEAARVKGHTRGMVTDLVALVRVALNQQDELEPFADAVERRYQSWLDQQDAMGRRFTPEQRKWLGMIKDHIAASLSIEAEDFDFNPFLQEGGLGKAHQVFGDELQKVIEELNGVLAA